VSTERLHRVVADVFGVPYEDVSDATSAETVENWDSLTHIDLVVALESEFGVSLSPEEMMAMGSVAAIREVLAERGALA